MPLVIKVIGRRTTENEWTLVKRPKTSSLNLRVEIQWLHLMLSNNMYMANKRSSNYLQESVLKLVVCRRRAEVAIFQVF